MMSREEIEEIEKAKEDLIFFNEGDYITREMDKSANVLEEYIAQLEAENNKQNKMIEEMATLLGSLELNKDREGYEIMEKEDWKQYFEKKVDKNAK